MVRNSNLRLMVFGGALICTIANGQTQTPAPAPQTQSTAGTNAPEMATRDATPTFTSRSNLVLVRVVARDREGRVNGTLQKEDFQLLDKGKPQFISKFSVEKTAPRQPDPAPAENPGQPRGPSAPERYIAYVFDDVHLAVGDLAQARIAAEKHLSELAPSSRAAIYTTSGLVTQDFTDDVALLRDTMQRIQPHSSLNVGPDCPQLTYYQADLIQNKNDPSALDAATQDAILCASLIT